MRLLLVCFLSIIYSKTTFAQDSIDEKMKWYALAKPTGNLFVHFDKNVYSNNETIYFTGYLIKEAKLPIPIHKVMAVTLIREVDSALIAEDKFIMNKGISWGSLTLPDSIPTGNYRLLVYTDKLLNNIPEVLFIQEITIKSSIEPSFNANVKLIEQTNTENKSYKVLISATSKEGRFLAKPTQINYRYGGIKKTTTTDASGQAIITLAQQKNLVDQNLYVKLKYQQDSTFISVGLPLAKNKAIVKFYPEGGNMVNNLVSTIGWEVKDQQNRPIALKAFLFKNQKVIDTIETTSYGIGKFLLKPETGANYSVKLVHSGIVDSIYYLPKAMDKGLSITLQNAIVEDTLRFNLKSIEKLKLTLLVHNFKTCFQTIPFNMSYENINLKIPLEDVPKGLTTLTIVDSLNQPLAERIFFAHYSDTEKMTAKTDKEFYNQREKVNLKINLNVDEDALVSVAVVQNNRLELKKMNDIESYTYLINELSTLPIINNGRPYKDRSYLEQILLIKGWRRYTWQDLAKSKLADTLSQTDSLKIGGQVSKLKKEVEKPLIIGTFGSQGINLINTTNNGFFKLNEDQLITPPGKKMYVFVNGVQKLPYLTKIVVNDEFSVLNQKLGKLIQSDQPILPSNLVNNAELLLKNNEKMIRLKEVVISNKNDNRFNYSGANACGDYVCLNNVLNCRNHTSGGRQPIQGRSYISGNGTIIYAGCNVPDQSIFSLVKGIHLQKEFYNDDYKDPKEPAYFSTIYWSYGTVLTSKKEAELSFYTSDITGKFRVVVQGITDKDVVYTEHFFEVNKQ